MIRPAPMVDLSRLMFVDLVRDKGKPILCLRAVERAWESLCWIGFPEMELVVADPDDFGGRVQVAALVNARGLRVISSRL